MPFIDAVQKNLTWRNIPYLLVIPIVLFQALSLSGCVSTSPSLPGLYILSFSKNTTSFPEIRLGYFGMCASTNSSVVCHSTNSSPETIYPLLFPAPEAGIDTLPPPFPTKPSGTTTTSTSSFSVNEILPILTAARTVQSQVFTAVLAGAGVFFLAALASLALHSHWDHLGDEAKARLAKKAVIANLGLSTALGLAACLSTWTAAKALQLSPLLLGGDETGEGAVVVRLGVELQVLQWLAFSFTVLFACGLPVLFGRGGGKFE